MIHIKRGSKFDGYIERVTDRIMELLTPETRNAILRLKFEIPDDEQIAGIEYYKAVLSDGIRTFPEFAEWRRGNPLTGTLEWMP